MPGSEGLWVFLGGDLAIFTMLFVSFLTARRDDPAAFEAARATLDPGRGGVNTILLLVSSWCVVMCLREIRGGRVRPAQCYLAAAIVGGVSFAVLKISEYVATIDAGHADEEFYTFYFSLTGLHLAHVIGGCVVLAVFLVRWQLRPPAAGSNAAGNGFESAALFWHLVDFLWIVIFPLLYLTR
jgi:nitric oxide reductase NorE protein